MVSEKASKEYSTSESVKNLFNFYYRKSREIAENKGGRFLLNKSIQKLKSLAYSTNAAIWFCRQLDLTISEITVPGIGITLASQSEFESWLQAHQVAFPWIYVDQEVLATRNDAKLSFVAQVDGRMVGYLKIAVKKAYVLDYDSHLTLPDNVAFIQDTFVLPEFRRRGVAKSIISNALKYLRAHGYCKVFCHIPKWNNPSITTYEGLGFQRVGHIRFLRIFKVKSYTTKPEKLIWGDKCH